MTMRRKLQLTGTTMGRSRWIVLWYEKEMDQCVNRLCLGFLRMAFVRCIRKRLTVAKRAIMTTPMPARARNAYHPVLCFAPHRHANDLHEATQDRRDSNMRTWFRRLPCLLPCIQPLIQKGEGWSHLDPEPPLPAASH